MSTVCNQCGGTEIDVDQARGETVCINCGSVLESNLIVAEVQFQENSAGVSRAVGQYVGPEGNFSHNLGSAHYGGFGKDSRQFTIQRGERQIRHVGSQLKLKQNHMDAAARFFKIAVSGGFTRGYKTTYTIASCIYIACRIQHTSHMLLDIADVIQENVYTLGHVYVKLADKLGIRLPSLDPALYIHRFAHKLEFGDKTEAVANSATRLVSRMKRDWLSSGRRPAGLCGAALLVAARIHNFSRTMKEVIKVVKVGENTIKKRLLEFELTPSSQLTIDAFNKIELEEECDPPSFLNSKKKAKIQPEEDLPEVSQEIERLQDEIEEALQDFYMKKFPRHRKYMIPSFAGSTDSLASSDLTAEEREQLEEEEKEKTQLMADAFLSEEQITSIMDKEELSMLRQSLSLPAISLAEAAGISNVSMQDDDAAAVEESFDEQDAMIAKLEQEELKSLMNNEADESEVTFKRPSIASLGIFDTAKSCINNDADEAADEGDGELDLTGIDDDEIAQCLYTEKEAQERAVTWFKLNVDYLREQREKQKQREKEEEEERNKPDHLKKKKRQNRKRKNTKIPATAGEAVEKMLQEKKISNKINYEVLRNLNNPSLPGTSSIAETSSADTASNSTLLSPRNDLPTSYSSPSLNSSRFRQSSITLPPPAKRSRVKEEPVKPAKPASSTVPSPVKVEGLLKLSASGEPEVIVETGPVQYDEPVEEEDFDDEDEDEHIGGTNFMDHGVDYEEYEDYGDEYY